MPEAIYKPYRQNIARPAEETPITPRQRDVLNYIKGHIVEYGFSPSHREISEHFEFQSIRSAGVHLRELNAKGYIVIRRRMARAIQIVNPEPESATV